jgi:hypothetical protein
VLVDCGGTERLKSTAKMHRALTPTQTTRKSESNNRADLSDLSPTSILNSTTRDPIDPAPVDIRAQKLRRSSTTTEHVPYIPGPKATVGVLRMIMGDRFSLAGKCLKPSVTASPG